MRQVDEQVQPEGSILVLAPLGRDAEVACTTLADAGIAVRPGRSLDDLRSARLEDLSALVLTEELLTEAGITTLAARLDAQPSWSSLPVILLVEAARHSVDPRHRASMAAFESRPGVAVLERPMQIASFVSVLRSSAVTRQKQFDLRDELQARAHAEAHARMLADEMKHRVKNAFAMAISIASQTFRNSETLDEARLAFSARLTSMARAQDLLTARQNGAVDFRALIEQALEPYRPDPEAGPFEIHGPRVLIEARVATAFAMALHELATNATKYGALSVGSGSVRISWACEKDAEGSDVLTVEWRERGGPPVTPPRRRGFGSRLVEQALAEELGGSAEISFDPEGLVCRIRAESCVCR